MFRLIEHGDLKYYKISSFDGVKHCFTTKKGGVSKGIYESMNLRFHSDDTRENVIRNFEIICEETGINLHELILSNQVHEDKIINVTREDCGNGIFSENKFESADGLITDDPQAALVTFYADCVPIFLFDKKKKVIASVHSGWKGTVKRIGQKAVEKFKSDYHSDASDIVAATGPSIRCCHFEVGEEIADIFEKEFGRETVDFSFEKPHVNLQKAVRKQLEEAGVSDIDDSGICTYCESDLLFSHRKTQGKRGNMAAFMRLDRKE